MGYGGTGRIVTFWPDDTDTIIYLDGEYTMANLIAIFNEKWPTARLHQIEVSSEHIHTNCLTYDLHDPDDYTTFTVLTYNEDIK